MNKENSIAAPLVGKGTGTPIIPWRPTRRLIDADPAKDQIVQLQKKVSLLTTPAAAPPTINPAGPPAQVTGVSASETSYTVSGAVKSLVSVSFTPHANFAQAQVWFTGYAGITTPQLMASGFSSPIQLLCSATGETVTVTVVAVNGNGVPADFSSAPTTTVVLNGANTAPPAPTIATGLSALPSGSGWQFAFNVLSGLLTDVIAGYWVYRSSTSATPTAPAGRYQYFAQPPSNIGTMTFQDYTTGTYYYWVSAVSVSGLESSLTSAASVSVTGAIYPASYTGSFSNPTQALDGNETTSSGFTATTTSTVGNSASATETWSGFTNLTGVTRDSLTLQIMSGASLTNNSQASLAYSLDGGTTWTTLWTLAPAANDPMVIGSTYASRSAQYSSITLPITQDLSLIQVRATCSGSTIQTAYQNDNRQWIYHTHTASVSESIYEVRVDAAYH